MHLLYSVWLMEYTLCGNSFYCLDTEVLQSSSLLSCLLPLVTRNSDLPHKVLYSVFLSGVSGCILSSWPYGQLMNTTCFDFLTQG